MSNVLTGSTTSPTIMPTFTPTNMSTTTISKAVKTSSVTLILSTDGSDSGGGEMSTATANTLAFWEVGGYICLVLVLSLPVLVVLVHKWYEKQHAKELQGCDRPHYLAVFLFFWHMGDLYSDLIFCGVLFVEATVSYDNGDEAVIGTLNLHHLLLYGALSFSIIPHMCNNVVSLLYIKQWQGGSIYITKYIDRYDWLIVFISVVAGFYSAIELVRSNLFYLPMFSMQIKTDEYQRVQKYRFLNTALFENIPQIFIQIVYMMSKGKVDIFALNAMLFSVLSAMVSFSYEISRKSKAISLSSDKRAKYFYRSRKSYKMRIICEKLQSQHRYTHNLLTKIICHILGIDNVGNVQIFYTYNVRNAIIAYMEVSNVDFYGNVVNVCVAELYDIEGKNDQLFNYINMIGVEGSVLNQALKQELRCRLGWDSDNNNNNSIGLGNKSPGCKQEVIIRVKIEEDKQGLGQEFMHVKNFAVTSTSASPTGGRSPAWSVSAASDSNTSGIGVTVNGTTGVKPFELN